MGASDRPEYKALSELICSYWVNFPANGDPNGPGLPEWPAFGENEQQVMYFNGETGPQKHPNLDKIVAFDSYYRKVREASRE